MEYILFIHNNESQPTTSDQWQRFFSAAKKSGIFSGGSEISRGVQIGAKKSHLVSDHIDGYMRFETDDIDKLYQLLELHPVKIQGGTLELCETPKT